MKKKLLLSFTMAVVFVCLFAICINAAQRKIYQSYEVELVNGEKITVYQAEAWDQWQGRAWITNNMYTEPPVDDEQTYPTVDWALIKVLDFTNACGHVYNEKTGEYERKIGTNNGGSLHLCRTGDFTTANATSLEKVITGAVTLVSGNVTLGRLPALKEIVVDNALLEFGWNSVDGSQALTTVTIKDGTKLGSISQQAFKNCTSLVEFHMPDTLTSMKGNVFDGCTSLKTVTWSKGLTTIPDGTFNDCTSLQFEIPSWITSIGSSAFKNCDSITSISIPDGVTSVGNYVFSSCDKLEKIIITDNSQVSNKIIGFAEYCPKLTSIRIPPLVTDIGYDNFRGCTSLSEVIWPNNLLKISGGQNFTNTSYTKVTIPNSVTFVGEGNFSSNIEEINFGANVTALNGKNLISKSLKRVYFSGSITSIGSSLLGYSNPTADSSMNITFICTGTLAEAEAIRAIAKAAIEGTNNAPNMSKFYDAVLVSAADYDVTQEPSGFTFVYGYNLCDAFYEGEHAMSGDVKMNFKGYFNDVTYEDVCTRGGCGLSVVDSERTISAMFTYRGYSCSQFSNGTGFSVVQGFKVNKESISKYVEATGDNSFVFGVVATANVGGEAINPIVDGGKVLSQEFKNLVHDYFEIKISGITEDLFETNIVFCAYVIDNGDVSYLDGEATEIDGETVYVGVTKKEVCGVAYNDLK